MRSISEAMIGLSRCAALRSPYMVVKLRDAEDSDRGSRIDAYVDEEPFAFIRWDTGGTLPLAVIWPLLTEQFALDDLSGLLLCLIEKAKSAHATGLSMSSPSILCRYQARCLGFSGGLRDPLVIPLAAQPIAQQGDQSSHHRERDT